MQSELGFARQTLRGVLPSNPSSFSQRSEDSRERIPRSWAGISFSLFQRTHPLTISLASGKSPQRPPNPVSAIRSQNISSGLSLGSKKSYLILKPLLVVSPMVSTQFFEPLITSRANLEHTPQSLSNRRIGLERSISASDGF